MSKIEAIENSIQTLEGTIIPALEARLAELPADSMLAAIVREELNDRRRELGAVLEEMEEEEEKLEQEREEWI
jgi:septal ring factor EnvC (AmiA/AmiB activator)